MAVFLSRLALLGAGHRALAQSSLTVSMAWEHDNPWIASSVFDFDDITEYEIGCHTTADLDDCIIQTPFTLTQASSFARFTTTLPGKTDSTVIHYCDWTARTPGCGWSENFGDDTWATFFRTPDDFSHTQTVIPLVTSADFLTIDESSDTDAIPTGVTSANKASTYRPTMTAMESPDEDDEDGGGGPRGGIVGPPGGFPGIDLEDDEGHANGIFPGHFRWVAGVVIAIGAVLV